MLTHFSFSSRLQALAPDSPPEAVSPLIKDTGLVLTPFQANLVLRQLETQRRWQHALLFVRWMEGRTDHPPKKDTYAKLFAILAAAGEYDKVSGSALRFGGSRQIQNVTEAFC